MRVSSEKTKKEARAGFGPPSSDPGAPCWRTALPGTGPQGVGPTWRSAACRRLPSQLDRHTSLVAVPVDAELHLVTGPLLADRVAQLLDRGEARAVDLRDQVAPQRVRFSGEHRALLRRPKPRLCRGAARLDARDEQTVGDGKAEELRRRRGYRLCGDAEVGVLDVAGPDQLRGDSAHGVDGNREPDPDVSAGAGD